MPRPSKSVTRRKHTNSKLGCSNCKRKKIRCDENLPQCGNCLRAKRETCSYLALDRAEVNRIRLTHSLRNSQNKLLTRNHRLPTSTNNSFDTGSTLKTPAVENTLEFKFEHTDFENEFPSVPYLSFQFNNTFMSAFDMEYLHDDDERTPSDSGTDDFSKALPNSTPSTRSFKMLAHKKVLSASIGQTIAPFVQLVANFNPSMPFGNVMLQSNIWVGAAIILNRMKQDAMLEPAKYSRSFLAQLEARCTARFNDVLLYLPTAIERYTGDYVKKETVQDINTMRLGLTFAGWCSFLALSLLNFSRPIVMKNIIEGNQVFSSYVNYAAPAELHSYKLVKGLISSVKENMMFIHIPSYEPAFLFEMRSTLGTLGSVFNHTASFPDPEVNKLFQKLNFYYSSLLEFFDSQVLPVVYSSRNEQFLTTYPPGVIFDIVRKWWCIRPTEIIDFAFPGEGTGLLHCMANTLYLYYYAISVALDSVFPATRYLFTAGFEGVNPSAPATETAIKKKAATFNRDEALIEAGLAEFLRRHNIYAMRVFAFFRKRVKLYQDNVIWRSPYTDNLARNRFASRQVKNALEIPIRSFTTLAIRPEHYAKKIHSHYELLLKDPSINVVFSRQDEPNGYTYGQTPTLDLFNLKQTVSFLSSTLFCEEDYMPGNSITSKEVDYHIDDLRHFCEDRIIILRDLVQ